MIIITNKFKKPGARTSVIDFKYNNIYGYNVLNLLLPSSKNLTNFSASKS